MVGLSEAGGEGTLVPDAFDFKGRPAVRSRTGRWASAVMILGVELCERLTTLGIGVNLVTYLTGTMHLGSAVSANTVTNFFGTSFMLCLLGGFIADAFLGRYRTIAIFAAVQASGVAILATSTVAPGLRPQPCKGPTSATGRCEPATGVELGVLYLGLYLTALGTGGTKSSVSGLGTDQFDEADPSEKAQMIRFCNWFFFFVNLGALLGVTVLVYIQDHVSRGLGYGICAMAIMAGLAVFLAGTKRYRFKKLAESPLTQIAAVAVAAWRKRDLDLPSDPTSLYDLRDGEKASDKQRLPHTKQFRFLDRAAIVEGPVVKQDKWRLSTLTDVEEVKQVIRMLPIWATTIMFWTVYAQMTTFSVAQAKTMDRSITPRFQIPAGSLTVFFVASVLLTVPAYDRLVLPAARRLTGDPHGLTPLQRIGVGLLLSVVAMVAAALTERKRLRVAWSNPLAAEHGSVLPIPVFWLVPQFFFVGSGVAFTYIGQLDLFLRECPKGIKTVSTGVFLTSVALGFFMSSLLVIVVHKLAGGSGRGAWLADNLNLGKLYNFYWLLAVLGAVNLALFLVAARWYVYKEKRMAAEDARVVTVELAGEVKGHA